MGREFVYNSSMEPIAARAREAKTTFELAKYCEQLNIADKIYLGDVDLWLAKLSLSAAYGTLKRYPKLRPYLNYFGTLRGFACINQGDTIPFNIPRNAVIRRNIKERIDDFIVRSEQCFAADGLALAFNMRVGTQTYSGILINEKRMYQQTILQKLEQEERIGFSPRGCKNIKYLVEHEIGHLFDFMLQIENSKQYREYIRQFTVDEVSDGLSQYAAANGQINDGDVIAEAYAEYHNNPNPRPIATFIGRLIDNEYQRQCGNIRHY